MVVDAVDTVGELTDTLELQGGSMVTLAKTKFTGFSDTNTNTFWATSGQELAESNPGTSATLSSLESIYTINISDNPFAPAFVGQIISVIEVNSSDNVVGFGKFAIDSVAKIGTNNPPVAKISEISILTGEKARHCIYDLFTNPDNPKIYYSNIIISNPSVLTASNIFDDEYLNLNGMSAGNASVSFEVSNETTGDKIEHTLNVLVVQQAPDLNFFNYEMPFTNMPISFIVKPNNEWFKAITSVEVNDVVIQPDDYTLTAEKELSKYGETFTAGEILFDPGVLKEGKNQIVVNSGKYASATTETVHLHKSEESFYTSPLTINHINGVITVTFKSLRNFHNESYSEQATAIFQLMNGDVPVSTVSFTIGELDSYQSYRAQFSLGDTTINSNYTVRSFLITGDNADNSLLGHNLSTEVSQEEFDALYQESRDY